MSRELVETFAGPNGTAEVLEVVTTPTGAPAVEKVEYEVVFNGARATTLPTMGEASIVACELTGDPRFSRRSS
jgi:hypothetical protein